MHLCWRSRRGNDVPSPMCICAGNPFALCLTHLHLLVALCFFRRALDPAFLDATDIYLDGVSVRILVRCFASRRFINLGYPRLLNSGFERFFNVGYRRLSYSSFERLVNDGYRRIWKRTNSVSFGASFVHRASFCCMALWTSS